VLSSDDALARARPVDYAVLREVTGRTVPVILLHGSPERLDSGPTRHNGEHRATTAFIWRTARLRQRSGVTPERGAARSKFLRGAETWITRQGRRFTTWPPDLIEHDLAADGIDQNECIGHRGLSKRGAAASRIERERPAVLVDVRMLADHPAVHVARFEHGRSSCGLARDG